MNKFLKVISVLLCAVMFAALFAACDNGNDPSNQTDVPAATATPEPVSDEPETTLVIAKTGGEPVYESEFYYFLYQGLREIYYKEGKIYDENMTDEENLANMKAFFYSEDEEGVTYLRRAADRTMEVAQGFKVAYILGKEASEKEGSGYKISEEELAQILEYIDSEADYGASLYGCTRDEYFTYVYGMSVNDAKRYTRQQMYAEMHETAWSDENNYSFTLELPEEPEEPTEPSKPADDADEETKAKYETDIAEYNTKKAEYDTKYAEYQTKLTEYEAAFDEYMEKFRPEYDADPDAYRIKTIRYLVLSKLDDDGNPLSESACAEKRKNAESYVKLVEDGLAFENIVKGFSESETVSSDLGLVDVNFYNGEAGSLSSAAIDWVHEADALSEKPEIIESDREITVIMVIGITDFDQTVGLISDPDNTSVDNVRGNVQYSMLARLYNEEIEARMKDERFALTDVNEERMMELATSYLEFEDNGPGGSAQ
ncbi:MAG: hypothetical protein J6T65_04570 [Clostridia bacterium]|nr:hypothetical protein [Clostridia bacterium]